MDYVPDVAAFKELDFKGADSYIWVVRNTERSVRGSSVIFTAPAEQAHSHETVLRAPI